MTSTAIVPVDLFNPGQVFASLGIVEVLLALGYRVRGGFEWDTESSNFRCEVDADGVSPVAAVIEFLLDAEIDSVRPHGSELDTAKWSIATNDLDGTSLFPIPEPGSPATLPARLTRGEHTLLLDHWGDGTRRDAVKFWAGSGGYPGVALLRDSVELVRTLWQTQRAETEHDPFDAAAPQSSSFRLDWRRDYVPIDTGFSLNKHGSMEPLGYPLVETLAAIGLAHARPTRVDPRDKLRYGYRVPKARELQPSLLRAGLSGAELPFPTRKFDIRLQWPGQENQARCITDVVEIQKA